MKRFLHHNSFRARWSWLLLFTLILPAGCAQKTFGPPIVGDDYSLLKQQYRSYQKSFESCGTGLDGEVSVSWSHALDKISFSGYFKTLLPASVQFTALSPLNQPLFALSSNGDWFQSLDISKKIFRKGSLRAFAIRHEIPHTFVSGEWGAWLTGRPLSTAPFVIGIADDTENRGIWFSVAGNSEAIYPQEHTLVNLDERKVIERAVVDNQGKIAAAISYENWHAVEHCAQPMRIRISGLSFGAEAELRFSDVQESVLGDDTFDLPIPSGYMRQFLP